MERKAANVGKLTPRSARVLYASALSLALLAAAWAASTSATSRPVGRAPAASAVCVAPPTGMEAWYPGDGNANDIRGGYNGALRNGATFASGEVSQAFSFDGVDDFVQVPNLLFLNPSASLTLDAWVFVPAGANNDGTIIGKWGDSGVFANQRAYQLSYLSNGGIRFRVSDDAHQNDSTFQNLDTPAGQVPLDTWTHVAAVYVRATGTRTVYVNGTQAAQRTDPSFDITGSSADLGIGAKVFDVNSPNGFFKGQIDEAEVFNRALSQAEIQSIFLAGTSGKCRPAAVTNTNDGGAGSLRQAIASASGDGIINFAPGVTGTITLTSGPLLVGRDVSIIGPGADVLTISGNNADRVFDINTGKIVRLTDLSVANGRRTGSNDMGGGILNDGMLTLVRCTVSNNHNITNGKGGGIANNATLVILDSAIANNNAAEGGGIYSPGTLIINNSTISGNNAPNTGGGIKSTNGSPAVITSSTIAFNTSLPTGNAGGVTSDFGQLTLRSTIVAKNMASSGPDIDGSAISQGFNLVGNDAGLSMGRVAGDRIGTSSSPIDPLLGPLQNNGGRTQTHALLGGSPAIDAGDDSVAFTFPGISTDQRGLAREFNGRVDIGAFESQPRTLTVTNTADGGAGSLRQAILDANANVGTDTIAFQIPGAGVHTITPLSALPAVADPAVIDGYTQPGSSPNTLAVGDDAVILIELNGQSAAASSGLTVTAGFSTIQGLVIDRFVQSGVRLTGSNSNTVSGNFIGTNAAGTAALGNGGEGLLADFSSNNTVGGTTPAARNVISGNASPGIHIFGNTSTNNVVQGNYIGTNAAGTAAVGNNAYGVRTSFGATANTIGGNVATMPNVISGNVVHGLSIETPGNLVRGNLIGTDASGSGALGNGGAGVSILGTIPTPASFNTVGETFFGGGNVIAFNGGAGVAVLDGTGGRISSNSIHSNGGLGIDLVNGANNGQSSPSLTSATLTSFSTAVDGTLNSTPNQNFRVEFFKSPSCDPSGGGEGQTFLGSVIVMTGAGGGANVSGSFVGVAAGDVITATAMKVSTNDTSEFSQCVTVQNATTLAVTNTADTGAGSLRQAIDDANNTPGTQTIQFNIPGAGVHTISPLSALPTITSPVIIDGYTQPGSSPNTLAVGNDAVLLVELNGQSAGASNGLNIRGGSSIVRGLVVNGFDAVAPVAGISVSTSGGNLIVGNYIGTNAAGTAAVANNFGVRINGCANNSVGGEAHADRNLISGNGGATDEGGVEITGAGAAGNKLLNNYIGTDRSGTADLGNADDGVHIHNLAHDNTVGGTTAAARNVVSGNNGNGLDLVFTANNVIQGNLVGTDANGNPTLGNGNVGILVVSSSGNQLGGTAAGAGNTIAANSRGIDIVNGTGNRINSNSIFNNTVLGIDLGQDGITPNDALDADAGANNLQNFPVITSAPVGFGGVFVFGTLGSRPDRNFTVQFFSNSSCDPSGNGEGARFVGSANVTTDASGNAPLAAGPFPGPAAGDIITATATDNATNDTSEFSPCLTAAAAAALTVTNTEDDGDGSLRRALATVADGGKIDFAPEVRGTVTLAGELVVNRRVTIVGPGANLLTLSGHNERRLLNVEPGGAVSVFKLSFSNGSADDGGAILNAGSLTLTDCKVSISKAAHGGAVFNAGSLNVEGSTLNSNSADEGGGIFNAGAANVSASTFNGNVARAGGAVFNGSAGVLNVTNSTVSDNRADARGGGIANEGGRATIDASTVAANASLGQAHSGGGVSNANGSLSLRSSIVADNTSAAGADDLSGAINSLDFNLIGDASGANLSGATAHNKTGVAPLLGPLQNNGGPADTRALLFGSPALDAGDDALALTLGTDQRGRPRKVDGDSNGSASADIGALENGFSVSGIVRDKDTVNLAGVSLTLSDDTVSRSAVSRAAPLRQNNFTIMDVPAGDDYRLTTEASLQLNKDFAYAFDLVCVAVSEAGAVTANTCDTGEDLQGLNVVGTKQEKRFALIEGRVTDGAGRGVGGVTITLSGPKTTVFNVPECQDVNSGSCGRYEFKDVPTGADYTMTPKRDSVGFFAHPFDNGRGGADMNNLGAGAAVGADGKVTVGVDFDAGLGPAPPAPSDNFTSPTPDPNRFKSGVVSLAPESFEPAVRVVQGEGQLQITPPAFDATPPQQQQDATQAAAAQVERFNGYVSVRDIDLNTSTSVGVRADQPIADGGAQTVFSVGSDSENFYRIRVGASSSGLGPIAATSQVRAGETATEAALADAPAIFFEAFTGGSKFQSAMPFDKSVDVFWRLRFEPRTPTTHAVCTDASAQTFVLFETSVDRSFWTTRYCAPLGSGRTHVAAELLAGIVGNTTRDPGTAKFSDYRVAERTGIGFERPDTFEVESGAQSVEHLRLTRRGDVSSAASVVLKVGGSATSASTQPCAASVAPPCKVFFKAGETEAGFSFANPIPNAAEGDRLTLTLEDASGGALDAGSASLTLDVVDRGFRGNKIGESGFFASQHYCDFLNRPPDEAGLAFWTNEVEKCGADEHCREVRRVNVSAAFFLSIEYKETSYFVYKLYELSFGRKPLHAEMLRDAGAVGAGVVVGREHWQDILEANKRRFVEEWMQGADFKQRFDGLKSADFVDALYANAGVTSPDVRTKLILELVTGHMTRAQVLRAVAEDEAVTGAHRNRAFVLTQYFGYLRRDPDDVGFNFWLKKLDDFKGDFVAAEMVKAFIDSGEYKARFKDKPMPSCGP
ncbi:MAG TPA: choice-of-anchor Q domain-containing protein [Pyrinomonadaceae bacterium]|jgi:hypothetical protein|nr:choice-of-anchor Q domain-containing protein [Pyrinomonadaceae bacterium]